MFSKRFHRINLVPLNKYAKNILSKYPELILIEYDDFGRALNTAPNGQQGIFCMDKTGFWNGWLILDEDVRFEDEQIRLNDIINEKGSN